MQQFLYFTQDAATPGGPPAKPAGGKYVPPNLRGGGNRRGESMQSDKRGKWQIQQSSIERPLEKYIQNVFLKTGVGFPWGESIK